MKLCEHYNKNSNRISKVKITNLKMLGMMLNNLFHFNIVPRFIKFNLKLNFKEMVFEN